jgi:type VI secretion system protein ImpJ
MTTQVGGPAFDGLDDVRGDRESLPPLAKPDWPLNLFLQPAHFDAQDRYHENFVRFTLRMVADAPWGVSEAAIDEDALAAGQFRLTRFRAILPDTTPVLAGVSGAAPVPPRSLMRRLGTGSTLDVYVGLPLEQAEAGLTNRAAGPRYVAEVAEVTDAATGRSPVRLPWKRPNLRILFEDEALDAYSAIPIARLVQVQGRVQLDPSFIPPVLRVRASAALQAHLRRIERGALAAKAAVYDARRASSEMSGGDAARLAVGMTLGRVLPILQATLAAEAAHPREAYRAAAELAGALSAFVPSGEVTVPPFDFFDLSSTFTQLEEVLRDVLEALSSSSHRKVKLVRHDEYLWRASLTEPGITGREFFLVLSGGDPANLHANIPRAIKIAAFEEIGELISRAVPGVPVMPEIRPPGGVAIPPQSACFRLEKGGSGSVAWTGVVRHGSIAIWLPSGFTALSPMLVTQERSLFGG